MISYSGVVKDTTNFTSETTVVVVGAKSSGKTSIILRFLDRLVQCYTCSVCSRIDYNYFTFKSEFIDLNILPTKEN